MLDEVVTENDQNTESYYHNETGAFNVDYGSQRFGAIFICFSLNLKMENNGNIFFYLNFSNILFNKHLRQFNIEYLSW